MVIQPNNYDAKVIDYGMGLSSTDNLMVYVQFEFLVDEYEKKLVWSGSLASEKSKEIALKALKVCGYIHDDFLPELADGINSNLLDTDKMVSIVVEVDEGNDGKEYNKIAWINELGGSRFRNQITKEEAIKRLKGLNVNRRLDELDEIPF